VNDWCPSRGFPALFGIARKGNRGRRRYQVVHKISKSRRGLKIRTFMSRCQSARTDRTASGGFTKDIIGSIPRVGSRCYSAAARHIVGDEESLLLNQGERMKSVNELLELFTRQAALEKAMRQPGGARVTEERELLAVRRKLAKLPEAMGVALPDQGLDP
jgi:hypothetical protein